MVGESTRETKVIKRRLHKRRDNGLFRKNLRLNKHCEHMNFGKLPGVKEDLFQV